MSKPKERKREKIKDLNGNILIDPNLNESASFLTFPW